MMNRFNSKIAAAVLGALGLIYMVASLTTGRSARAEFPVDLSTTPSQLQVDVWQAADLLLRDKDDLAVIDVRTPDDYKRYHLPMSNNEFPAQAQHIAQIANDKKVLLIGEKDEQSAAMVTAARSLSKSQNIVYLKGGAGSFYLTFELPIPLFSDKEVPFGYQDALSIVKNHFEGQGKTPLKLVQEALATLVRLSFEPTALKKTGKPKSAGKKRKKIVGGCG